MRTLICSLFLFCIAELKAQPPCATTEQLNYLMATNKAYATMMNNRELLDAAKQPLYNKATALPDTIPVVVHVINTGGAIGTTFNPLDASINNMINALNLSFSASYPSHPTTINGGVDIGIFFKLAMTGPDCQPTNGIMRVNASEDAQYMANGISYPGGTGGISHAQLAAKSYWNNTQYLNIWIVNKLANPAYAGYAYYPTGAQTIYDGIVINTANINGPYVIAHEAGHWLNLYHTFEGQSGSNCPANNNCSTDGDKVCDTPPVLNIASDPVFINPCTNQQYGFIGRNYMSYETHDRFTPGQKERMMTALYVYRSSILNGNRELPPQDTEPRISSDDTDNIICGNQTVSFSTSVSGSSSQVYYQWMKNDTIVGSAATYILNNARNGDRIKCFITRTIAPCTSLTTTTSNTLTLTVPLLKPSITIHNNKQLSTTDNPQSSFLWTLNNQPIQSSNSPILNLTSFGTYSVTQTVSNCQATSAPISILPLQRNSTVLVFPNPFTNTMHGQTTGFGIVITSFRLFTADGKLLQQSSVNNQHIFSSALEKYPAGLYMVEFSTNQGKSLVKVVKQ